MSGDPSPLELIPDEGMREMWNLMFAPSRPETRRELEAKEARRLRVIRTVNEWLAELRFERSVRR